MNFKVYKYWLLNLVKILQILFMTIIILLSLIIFFPILWWTPILTVFNTLEDVFKDIIY